IRPHNFMAALDGVVPDHVGLVLSGVLLVLGGHADVLCCPDQRPGFLILAHTNSPVFASPAHLANKGGIVVAHCWITVRALLDCRWIWPERKLRFEDQGIRPLLTANRRRELAHAAFAEPVPQFLHDTANGVVRTRVAVPHLAEQPVKRD